MEIFLENNIIKDKFFSLLLLFFLVAVYFNSSYRPYLEILFYVVFSGVILRGERRITPYMYWFLLFTGFSGLSLFWSHDIQISFLDFRILIQAGIIGNLLIGYIDTKEKLEETYKLFVYTGVILIIYLFSKLSFFELLTTRLGGIHRVGINSNVIGLNFSISTLFSYYFARKNRSKAYYFLSCIFMIFVFLSGSRQAMLFAVIGLCIMVYLNLKNTRQKIFFLGFGIILAVLSYLLLINVPILYEVAGKRIEIVIQSLFNGTDSDGSTQERTAMFFDGLNLISKKPMFGYGIRSFGLISGWGGYAHNNFIELLVGVGAVGTIIYYSIYFYIIKQLNYYKKNPVIIPVLSIMIALLMNEVFLVSYNTLRWQIIIALAFASVGVAKKHDDRLPFFKT